MHSKRENLQYSGIPGKELPDNNILFEVISKNNSDSRGLATLLESIPLQYSYCNDLGKSHINGC